MAASLSAIACILLSIAFAHLAGFTLWLAELPWPTWLLFSGFTFGLGLIAGAGLAHYGAYKGLIRHVYAAAARPQGQDMDTMLARIYLGVLDIQNQRSAEHWRELISAIAALTDSPLKESQCRHCGRAISATADPFAPSSHEPSCPVPLARSLVIRELSKLSS